MEFIPRWPRWLPSIFRRKVKLVLFENADYGGHKRDFRASYENLTIYFPRGVLSLKVEEDSEPWQVFTEVQFQGDAACLAPNDYLNVSAMELKSAVKSFRRAPHRHALKVFEKPEFGGTKKVFSESCEDLTSYLPEGASSFVVCPQSERWQAFTEVYYGGVTTMLEPGKNYKDKQALQIQDSIKSIRKAP